MFRARGAAAISAATLLLGACSPTLDWRELRAEGEPLRFMLPCKPSVQARQLPLAGRPVLLHLQACAAGGQTWGLASADIGDPALVGGALAELAQAAGRNIQGSVAAEQAASISGATPNPASRRLVLQGRHSAGGPVTMQLVLFTRGTHVYQASALGEQVPAEAADTFFGALRFQP
jgi:hypothetical protein